MSGVVASTTARRRSEGCPRRTPRPAVRKPAVVPARGRRAAAVLTAGATVTLLALAASPLSAQWARGTAAAGMGGAGMVFATGYDAVDWNPANLATSPSWTLSLMEVGGAGLLTGTTLGDFIDIATAGGKGDPSLVTGLPDDGFRISATTEGFAVGKGADAADIPGPGSALPNLGLSIGPVGLRIRSQILTEAAMSRELADLTVNGYNPERIREYAVRETGFRVASFSEVTLGYGYALSNLSLGVGVRYVQGHRLSQGRLFEPRIDLRAKSLDVSGVAVEAPGGSGWGVDLGFAVDVGGGVRWSMAVRNAFQSMSWEESLKTHQASFTDEDFDDIELADLLDRFEETDLDPSGVSLPVFEAARGLFDQAYFPMVVRTGLGWAGNAGTRVEVVASAVAPKGRQHAAWDQRLALGVEQRVGFLVLRGGFSRAEDGIQALSGGLGFRFGPARFDAGVGTLSGSFGGIDYDGLQASIGLSLTGGER